MNRNAEHGHHVPLDGSDLVLMFIRLVAIRWFTGPDFHAAGLVAGAELAAVLKCRRIVDVDDLGRDPVGDFDAMEPSLGKGLQQLCRKGLVDGVRMEQARKMHEANSQPLLVG